MEINYKDIGARIKEIRQKRNMPREELADLAHLSVPHISHIETANTKLRLGALVSIANALDVPVDHIVCGSLESSKPVYDRELQKLFSICDPEAVSLLVEHVKSAMDLLKEN